MSKMIQIRGVPDAVHRRLKARAATEGMSLSDFLLVELKRVAERPSREELIERLSRSVRSDLHPSPAELIREAREGDER